MEGDGLRQRTTAKVDFESRWKEVEEEFEKIEKEDTFQKRNAKRRVVYCKSEILLMDLEESGVERDDERAKKCLDLRDKLALEAAAQGKLKGWDKYYMQIRQVVTLFVFFATSSAMLICLPLRMLHPLLRMAGIPNDYLPMDIIQRTVANILCLCAGIRYRTEGLEKRTKSTSPDFKPHITMFAHPSNLDPIVLLASSPVVHKAVGKQVLFMMPIIGWSMRYSMGGVPLDRGNRDKAVRSLHKLESSVLHWKRSLAIAPEGTRQPQGQLQDFKKGPFHMQEDLNAPIAPVVHFGPYELFPRKMKFCMPGHVVIRFLPNYTPEEGMDRDQIRNAVRRLMLKSLATDIPADAAAPLSQGEVAFNFACMAFFTAMSIAQFVMMYQLHRFVFGGFSALTVLLIYIAGIIAVEAMTYYYIYLPSSAAICEWLFW